MIIPESPSSAREWDKTKAHYVRLGLDSRCAAQAAYGSQDGFAEVHPPCENCLAIVDTFPTKEPGLWRSYSRRHGRAVPQIVLSALEDSYFEGGGYAYPLPPPHERPIHPYFLTPPDQGAQDNHHDARRGVETSPGNRTGTVA